MCPFQHLSEHTIFLAVSSSSSRIMLQVALGYRVPATEKIFWKNVFMFFFKQFCISAFKGPLMDVDFPQTSPFMRKNGPPPYRALFFADELRLDLL